MLTHDWIPLADRARWEASLDGVPHDVGHTWRYCDALARTFDAPTFLYVFRDGDVRIVCPLWEREIGGHRDVATPPGLSGFVGTAPHPAFATHWTAFAAERGWVSAYVGLNPVLGDPSYVPPEDVCERNAVYLLDLRRDEAALFAGLDRNRRRQLRDWAAAAAPIIDDRARLTAFLRDEYPAFLRATGAAPSYVRSPATLERLCALDEAVLIGTEGSAYLFVHTAAVGTCLIHVARPEARVHAAALVWRGIQLLRERGVPLLNLGGGVREGDAIAASKQRFGATRTPLRALRQIFRPDVYAELCRRAGAAPWHANGFFPAYRSSDVAPHPVR